MNLARLYCSKTILRLALAAIVAMAFVVRLDYLILKGGLQADQVGWAYQYYFGGITLTYLNIRNAILSWTAEGQPVPYLPGYPTFLAVLHNLGAKDLGSVRLIQIVIDTVSIFPLYFILRSIGSAIAAALIACLIYAIAPWWGVGSTYLLGESLLPALMLFFMAGMLVVRQRADSMTAWFLLGLLSSILPFFRSDMMLLVGPLFIWALIAAPRARRLSSSASVVAGFVLPLLLWSTRNYFIHDQFLLTPPAKWYAAWAGLGQVANEFGYFVNDARAIQVLRAKGIEFNSIQSEAYWHAEYLRAWADHPGHVIRTILFRLRLILGEPDSQGFAPLFILAAYKCVALVTPVVLIWMLYRRRWAEAFLTALPMAYALGSLGFLYVELRYVRYAGLTYLMVLALVFTAAGNLLVAAWPGGAQRAEFRRSAVGAALFFVVGLGALYQLRATIKAAEVLGLAGRLDVDSVKSPISGLDDLAFRPALPSVEIASGVSGLRLQARVPAGTYLALAPLRAQENGVVIIRYHAAVSRGAIGFGVLSAGGERWLSHQNVPGGGNGGAEGSLVSPVEPGSQLVIDAQNADDGIDAVVSGLQWSLACPRPAGILRLFFSSKPIPARECSPAPGN